MTKWKLVPVEPTPEMVWKAEEDSPEFHHGDPWYGSEPPSEGQIRAIYTAMLEAAPPAPSVPDMPLSMEQFGGLVGLARDDASEKAIVYKATNIYGETCYFGVKSTAQAWAKSGSVDEVRLRDLRVVAAEREACAKVCEKISDEYDENEGRKYAELRTDAATGGRDCASAIRARDEKGQA